MADQKGEQVDTELVEDLEIDQASTDDVRGGAKSRGGVIAPQGQTNGIIAILIG